MAKLNSTTAPTVKKTPDGALLRLGQALHQQIETTYPLWVDAELLRRPLDRKLAKIPKVGWEDQWSKREAVRKAFERSAAGKKQRRAWKAFDRSSTECHRIASAIIRKQPRTLAGAAVLSIAAVYNGEWGGFGSPIYGGQARIINSLSRAAGLRLPKGIRECVKAGLQP